MTTLGITALTGLAVLLCFPSEAIHRLNRVPLHRAAAGNIGLIEQVREVVHAKRQRQERAQLVIDALASLDAELRSGQAPSAALRQASGAALVWPTALSAVVIGGDVSMALAVDARTAPVLQQLAACWKVAAHAGSGMSQAVERLTIAARHSEELRAVLDAELSAPRATTRVLSALPLVGVLLGVVMGADPLGWLIGGPFGWACLFAGLALTAIGIAWSRRLVLAVERQL
ncbi:MAG: hypothetical protein WC005_05485 [Candidatus Nanopelagicales bacterium]